jgi:hypothetical protein
VGSPEFAGKAASFSSYESFLMEIGNAEVEIDQWQLEKMALVGLRHELFFYIPGVANDKLGNLASRCFPSAQTAVAALLDGLPAGARVALVPEGPYVYARADTSDALAEVPQLS